MYKSIQKMNFVLMDGLRIAYQEWGSSNAKKAIALHGWLDNSSSFAFLGPYLAERGYHVVALDILGHGRTDHLGIGATYTIQKSTAVTKEIIDQLGWDTSTVIGHSMGASISVQYSAAFPHKTQKLVLIDGFGPLVRPPENTAEHLRVAIEGELGLKKRNINKATKMYQSLKDAIDVRLVAVKEYPGQQFLSRDASMAIVSRAVKLVGGSDDDPDLTDESAGPVQFRHDTRLLLPSYIYPTKEQGLSFFRAIQSPVLLVRGENGFPPIVTTDFDERAGILNEKGLFTDIVLPGSHHLHLDPETAPKAAETIFEFLKKE